MTPNLAAYHEIQEEFKNLGEALAWMEKNSVKTWSSPSRWRFLCFCKSNCTDESVYSESGDTPAQRFVNAYRRLREKVETPPLMDDVA